MNLRTVKCTVAVILLSSLMVSGEIIEVGKGSYSNQIPAGLSGPADNNGNYLFPGASDNVNGAIPTNDWCSSLPFKRDPEQSFSHTMYPHPLGIKCKADGLGIGYGNQSATGENYYAYGLPIDLTVGTEGLNTSETELYDYSDWTQTAEWNSGELRATYGHGLPFVYFKKQGGDAKIACSGTPQVWHDGGNILGITVGVRNYGLFAPDGSDWSVNGNDIVSDLDGKSYFSVAVLPGNGIDILNLFSRHAFAFVNNTEVSWEYDRENSRVITEFNVDTEIMEGSEEQPLMCLYFHQYRNSDAVLTDYSYVSPRGEMKLFEGSSFTTEISFTGVLPALPLPLNMEFDMSELKSYLESYSSRADGEIVRTGGDTYWTGKDLGRTAALVLIADQCKETGVRDRLLDIIKLRLEDWFTAEQGETEELFCHDGNWGSLIGYGASYGSAEELNDHHFHYGYFVMASAVTAMFDREWSQDSEWGGMVKTIIRDVANTQRGEDFSPFLRTFDPYAGHSWASGHGNFADGNNQESTSEAINFAAGVTLWGHVTGDSALTDLGAYLYSTEVEALQNYWMDVNDAVFPQGFTKTALGMVWGSKGDHATWFSAEPEMIHGINMLPITGASTYLGHYKDYVLDNYNEIVEENGGDPDQWRDVMWEYLAFADPDRAMDLFDSDTDYSPEEGETRAHTYHYIHSLKSLGRVNRQVSADIPCYAVFDSADLRKYVVYNTSFSEREVNFSDGRSFNVSADTIMVFTDENTALNDLKDELSTESVKPYRVISSDAGFVVKSGMSSYEKAWYRIYDLKGRQVKKGRLEFDLLVKTGSLSSGVYCMEIIDEKGLTTVVPALRL